MRVNAYGLLIVLGVFVAYWLTAKRAKRRGLSGEFVWDSLPWVVVFGIIGARLYHVLNYMSFYLNNPLLIVEVWRGGLGIFGAILGGLIGFCLYFFVVRKNYITLHSVVYFIMGRGLEENVRARFNGDIFWSYLDSAAPAIILGQAIGRIGNLFNRENLPYAYWEIGLDLFIFLVVILLERIRESGGFRGFSAFKFYIFFYSLGRLVLEFFRTDSPWIWGPLTVAQWVCLLVVFCIVGKYMFAFLHTSVWE